MARPPNRRLFRSGAFAFRGRTEPLDRPLNVTAPHEWAVVIGLGLALLGVVAWGFFGSIERSVAAGCVLVEPGERYTVVSAAAGIVTAVAVAEGDRVEAGQVIARVKLPELDRLAALARARVATLEETADAAPETLALARSELAELEALQVSGGSIVSPQAGEVAALHLAPGQAVAVGREVAVIRSGGGGGGLEAAAFVAPENANRLREGMDAQILTPASGRGGPQAVGAQVREVSPRPVAPPGWLADSGLQAPAGSHLVRLALLDPPPPAADDGVSCNVRVVLRKDPPVRLLTPAGAI